MTPEQRAREKITRLLNSAGWTYREEELAGRRSGVGFADYLMFDGNGAAVGILEAKRAETPPLSGKEQAREYADSIGVRHVFLSNGETHYHWVTDLGNPFRILALPKLSKIDHIRERVTVDRSRLWDIVVDENYLRSETMRQYQVEAVRAVQESAKAGNLGFLLEMATGTGKTTVAAAICRLYLEAGVAQDILFLVDRDELYTQAVNELRTKLHGQHRIIGLRELDEDPTAPIKVATVQAVNALANQGEPIPPERFQLVISDEAHRSISGPRHRDIFDAFNCDKVGLTATPRRYLESYNPDDETSVSGREARSLRDTYFAFGAVPGKPTFEYTIRQAVADGYLVMPHALDVRTEVTAQLMSDEGFQVTIQDLESGEDVDWEFHAKDYGRAFLSPDTNREFAEQYIENALREPETDIIGKGIIYCVNRRQAGELTNELNRAADREWPGRYRSDFAVQITHDVDRATEMGVAFRSAPNNLNGEDSTITGYKTSKTRVCVTVAMMTTGYDCPDLLNLGFCRPVKSPTDYVQMKGRGTRRHDFRENFTDQVVKQRTPKRPKEEFRIIDYFGVCEYFGEGDLYCEGLRPPSHSSPGIEPVERSVQEFRSAFVLYSKDQTESVTELSMNAEGAIVDRNSILGQRDADNLTLAQEFERYLEQHPVNGSYERENVQRLFEAYATDEATRSAIDSGRYAALSAAITTQQYTQVPLEHRQTVPEYIKNLNWGTA